MAGDKSGGVIHFKSSNVIRYCKKGKKIESDLSSKIQEREKKRKKKEKREAKKDDP